MPSPTTSRYITNHLLRAALLGISDVLGDEALRRVLRVAGLEQVGLPPDDDRPSISYEAYARLDAAIHQLYGPRAKAILRHIGAATFHRSLRDQALLLRLLAHSVKMLPERRRVRLLLEQMARGLTEQTIPSQEAWVEEDGDTLALCLRPCGLCTGRQSDEPLGHFLVGAIQAAIQWALGRRVEVVETQCMAMGHDHGRVEVRLKTSSS